MVTGPSGVGKGTLIGRLIKERPDKVGFSVSHTTRGPRPGEVDGTHYHFVSLEKMEEMVAAGDFIEYARVHTNIYGTSKQAVYDVQAQNKTCLLDIDTQVLAHPTTTTLLIRLFWSLIISLNLASGRLGV